MAQIIPYICGWPELQSCNLPVKCNIGMNWQKEGHVYGRHGMEAGFMLKILLIASCH